MVSVLEIHRQVENQNLSRSGVTRHRDDRGLKSWATKERQVDHRRGLMPFDLPKYEKEKHGASYAKEDRPVDEPQGVRGDQCAREQRERDAEGGYAGNVETSGSGVLRLL